MEARLVNTLRAAYATALTSEVVKSNARPTQPRGPCECAQRVAEVESVEGTE